MATLPRNLQQKWHDYQPLGVVDADFLATGRQGQWLIETRARCRGVSLLCEKFKYPLERAEGTVYYRQGKKLDVDLWATADRTPIHIQADITPPLPGLRSVIKINSNGWLPLDKTLTSALRPKVGNILREMEAQGDVKFNVELYRDSNTNGRFHKDIQIDVQNGSLRYKKFAYPLNRVRGSIHVGEQRWVFEKLTGRNDSCFVECNGQVFSLPPLPQQPERNQLELHFVATDIPCDEELRQALPAGPQSVWNSLQPTGSIDHAEIDLFHRSGMPKPTMDIVVTQFKREDDPRRRSLSIQPTWFPLQLDQLTGSATYRRDGSFRLLGIQAVHGPPHREVALRTGGGGFIRGDGSWDVHLERLTADGMEVTPELLSALPVGLGTALSEVRFAGRLWLDCQTMRFSGSGQPNTPVDSDWSMLVNVDGGEFQAAGHPFDGLFGQISIGGRRVGGSTINAGRARFDSLMYKDVHIRDLEVPWKIDTTQLILGAGATTIATPPDERHLRARVFGGLLEADGAISLSPDRRFQIEAVLNDGNISDLARDLGFSSSAADLAGIASARLDLVGNAEGTHTLDGRGSVRLRETNIARLPAIISLLNEVRLRDAPANVFSSSDIDFQVQGRHLHVNRFDLHGESLTLKGQGWISLDRRLDLVFYTILGGEDRWLPGVRPLLGQASQQFLQIQVTGSIDDAEYYRRVLPGLNETLQQLFPELARTGQRRSLTERLRRRR